jgi:hypothetical protein
VDHELRGVKLDLTSRKVQIHCSFDTLLHTPRDFDYRLGLNRAELSLERCIRRVKDDLGEAFAITQVDEKNTAVVANGIDPANESSGRTSVRFTELRAVMSAFHKCGDENTLPPRNKHENMKILLEDRILKVKT